MKLGQWIAQANQPGPPEHSVSFRLAAALSVVVAATAAWSQGELGPTVLAVTIVLTVTGNLWSWRRRARPWVGVKVILALAAVAGFTWFISTALHSANAGNITTIEGPLAVLFAWILSTHSFDVPARRDIAYSLAGSAALMAVAAAQSISLTLGLYVLAWSACGLWGLRAMWRSMSGLTGSAWRSNLLATVVSALVALVVLVLLPAPRVSTDLSFPSTAQNSNPVTQPAGLSDGASGLPAHAAPAQGHNGIGGFLGFASALDTGTRTELGNELIMRVRADRPNYWVGETFDHWNGQTWSQSFSRTGGEGTAVLRTGSPYQIPLSRDQVAPASSASSDIQTYYLARSGPNLVFHADNAQEVYIDSRALFLTGGDTITSAESMGSGTIYTVVSADSNATPDELTGAFLPELPASAQALPVLGLANLNRYLALPHAYPRVTALAERITGGSATHQINPYQAVSRINGWMATHVHYSTDIPPLPPGQDAVDSFLFGTRTGYCEQISTATVVMLRSLGIPARETVGYVPGSFNPITDLYDVQAKDAHAWVQVWFPDYGWQNFDPTADVPAANPAPGKVLLGDLGHALGRLPWIPVGLIVLAALGTIIAIRRRRRRPVPWTERIALDLGEGGARRGLPRRPGETLTHYGDRLASHLPEDAGELTRTVAATQAALYGGEEPSAFALETALGFARRFRHGGARREARRAVATGTYRSVGGGGIPTTSSRQEERSTALPGEMQEVGEVQEAGEVQEHTPAGR